MKAKVYFITGLFLISILFISLNYPTITGYITYGSNVISKNAWLNIVEKQLKENQIERHYSDINIKGINIDVYIYQNLCCNTRGAILYARYKGERKYDKIFLEKKDIKTIIIPATLSTKEIKEKTQQFYETLE